nr:SAM-dependent methyltransferase [Kibdelosporangium sp. MJ126-NF4]CEL13747.1 O-Methyltransferase involved in polyketide biosynthesis [Kibdelosporangium sp. MJ126-NF4]CTQ99434.1 O-Methyltransferase involved in polyketide biosynthesis [Kibdelosporangium sp. MJ126-NF4]
MSTHATPGPGLAGARGNLLIGSTAEGAALLRAAGALVADRRLRGPDTLAAAMIPWAPRLSALVKVPVLRRLVPLGIQRVLPGALWFEIVRTKFMDEVVTEEVETGEVAAGARQLVILGAGFDTRAYRMTDTLREVAVFEVDHPVTAARKRARLRAASAASSQVRYVTLDFNHEDLATRLADHGYDPAARSVVVWSGVAPYLAPHAVDTTLRWMARQAPDSCLVFDYCWQDVVDGTSDAPQARALARSLARQGEPLRWGIPRGQAAEYLAARGLRVEADHGARDAHRYLTRRDGSVAGPMWEFGGFVRARVPAP